MRYTLTNRTIAILLSVILILSSASGFIVSDENNTYDVNGDSQNHSDLDPADLPTNTDDDGDIEGPSDTEPVGPVFDEENPEDERENTTEEPSNDDNQENDSDSNNDYEEYSQFEALLDPIPFSTHVVWFYVDDGDTLGTIEASFTGSDPWVDYIKVDGELSGVSYGQQITFRAVPFDGNKIAHWGGELSGVTDLTILEHTITVTKDIEITVAFEPAEYFVSFGIHSSSASDSGSISRPTPIEGGINPFPLTPDAGGVYRSNPTRIQANREIEFTATPNTGFLIGNWFINGTPVKTGSTSFTSGATTSASPARTGDTAVTVSFLEGKKVEFGILPTQVADTLASAGQFMTASYTLDGGTSQPVGPSGNAAPEGAFITFTAPSPPGGINFVEYEWRVNGTLQSGQNSSTFEYTNQGNGILGDINVTVTYVQGFTVNFDDTKISAAYSGGAISNGQVIRENTLITFTSLQTANVYQYRWNVGGTAVNQLYNDTSPITPGIVTSTLTGSLTVSLSYVMGYTVEFGTVQPAGSGTVTAKQYWESIWSDITSDNTILHPEGSTIEFTVAPDTGFEMTSVSWDPSGGTPSTGEPGVTPPGRTYTISGLSSNINATARFISFELSTDKVTVTGHSPGNITPESVSVKASSTATGSITPDTSSIDHLDPGLKVTVIGDDIFIESAPPLNDDDNGEYEVHFEREGITQTITIVVDMPRLAINPDSIEITNATPNLEESVEIETNTDGTISDFTVLINGLPLPTGLSYEIVQKTPGIDHFYMLTITGNRDILTQPMIEDYVVVISRGGLSVELELKVNLTPFPSISSITPAAGTITEFSRVSIHGIPYGMSSSATAPFDAKFNVTGVSFIPENYSDIEEAIKLVMRDTNTLLHPTWFDGSFDITFSSSATTEATITVPLTIDSNLPPATDGRSGTVTFNIDTDIVALTGANTALTITQVEQISLTPSTVSLSTPSPLVVTTAVAGSGDIVIDDAVSGTFPANVKERLTFEILPDTDGNMIRITATRSATEAITGTYSVPVSRDGETVTLNLVLNIQSLDPVDVVWPKDSDFSATYGDLLSSSSLASSDAQGTAIPPDPAQLPPRVGYATYNDPELGTIRVTGTFSWTVLTPPPGASGTLVGDAGTPTHEMTFTPSASHIYASNSTDITITVAKATPAVVWPTGITVPFGQPLPTISGGSASFNVGGSIVSVPGTFSWANPSDPVGNVLNNPNNIHNMNFTPGDSTNYNNVLNEPIVVTVTRASQTAPAAPTPYGTPTAVSITINNIPNAEFIIRTSDIQPTTDDEWSDEAYTFTTPLTFEGLVPYTTYYIFARLRGDANLFPSLSSPAGIIQTAMADLGGTLAIFVGGLPPAGLEPVLGNVRYRDVLYADVSDLYADPPGELASDGNSVLRDFNYQWKRNGIDIGGATGSSYTLTEYDLGTTITVTVGTANTRPVTWQTSDPTAQVSQRPPVLEDLTYNTPVTVSFTPAPPIPNTPVTISGPDGIGNIEPQFSSDNGVTWSSTVPTDAGVYRVRAKIEGGEISEGIRYLDAEIPLPSDSVFTITRITPTLSDLSFTLPFSESAYTGAWDGLPKAATVSSARTAGWLGTISVRYHLYGDAENRFSTAPSAPGTYVVTVLITQGANYTAITESDPHLVIGSFTIQGTDITTGIVVTPVDVVFDGVSRRVVVVDEEPWDSNVTQIAYSLSDAGPWYSPTDTDFASQLFFRNATLNTTGDTVEPIRVYYRVIRPNSGFNPLIDFTTVEIRPKQLIWDIGSSSKLATANNKYYDGTNNATVLTTNAPSLSGVIAPDNVQPLQGDLVFEQENARNALEVTASDWGIDSTGTGAGNYLPPDAQPLFNYANIMQVTLTPTMNLTGVTGKEFDTLTSITGAIQPAIVLSGAIPGEFPAASATFSFVNANAGNNKSITTSNIALTGSWGINYTLSTTTLTQTSTVSITPKLLTWNTDGTVHNKTYDGTDSAVRNNLPSLAGLLSGNSVTITEGSVRFSSVNASSTPISIIANGWSISGDSNYTAPTAQPVFANATISPRQLTWDRGSSTSNPATVQSKVFDTATTATVASTPTLSNAPSLSGVLSTDNVTIVPAVVNFSQSGAGTDLAVTTTAWSIGGTSASNYIAPAAPPVFANANITQRQISGSVNISDDAAPGTSIAAGTLLTADISSIIGVPGVTSGSSVNVTYQWFRGNIPIDGETGNTYTVGSITTDPIDTIITVRVTGDTSYSGTISSTPVVIGKIPLSGTISISGSPVLNATLNLILSSLTPSHADYDITWLRNGNIITGETGTTYMVTQVDLGKTLSVNIVGKDGFTGSLSTFIAVPAVRPHAPQNLTAVPGNEQVTLFWDEPGFDGGSEVIKYHYSIDGGLPIEVTLFAQFTASLIAANDYGLFTPFSTGSTGPPTSIVIPGLTNGTEYSFSVLAENSVGHGDPSETIVATPVAPPQIISITPDSNTVALFKNVPKEGKTGQAVFEIAGIYLTYEAVTGSNVFNILQFPAWILPSNFQVEFLDTENAKVAVTLTILPNTEAARSGNLLIGNKITTSVTGNLSVSQEAGETQPTAFTVTILNLQNGVSIPAGQSESVRSFEPGESVSLIAGACIGYSFNRWSSESNGVVIDNTGNTETSFTMPANDVIIIATWSEIIPDTPPVPLSEFPPDPPDEPPDPIPPPVGNTEDGSPGTGPGQNNDNNTDYLPDSANATNPNPGGGFLTWLRNNLWWLALYLSALILFTTLWIVHFRKHRLKMLLLQQQKAGKEFTEQKMNS